MRNLLKSKQRRARLPLMTEVSGLGQAGDLGWNLAEPFEHLLLAGGKRGIGTEKLLPLRGLF